MDIYRPFKCKIKLSWSELMALNEMLGRMKHAHGLEAKAMLEWAIKKRMEFTRKLMGYKKEYAIALNAMDAWAATSILGNITLHDDFEKVLAIKIEDQVARLI